MSLTINNVADINVKMLTIITNALYKAPYSNDVYEFGEMLFKVGCTVFDAKDVQFPFLSQRIRKLEDEIRELKSGRTVFMSLGILTDRISRIYDLQDELARLRIREQSYRDITGSILMFLQQEALKGRYYQFSDDGLKLR